jgi:hypothetical protein
MAALSTAVKTPARMPMKINATRPRPGSADSVRSITMRIPGKGSTP